ncbi:DUF1924 domain-containing protein [Myxococcota bacterium]|nr:DUF1924 domain-containing protein [Myxococcota bacterium]
MKTLPMILALALSGGALAAGGGALPGLLAGYQAAGATAFDADRGAALWVAAQPSPDGGPARSCSSCHPADQRQAGRHARTGEPIEALSPAVVATRLSDPVEVEKWLGRNCKWTFGRECTPQEKGDLLSFINR